MKKKFIDAIRSLNFYLEENRQTGNTSLLKIGMENYDRPFIVISPNVQSGSHISSKTGSSEPIENAKIVPVLNIDLLRGEKKPIAIDPCVFKYLTEPALEYFDETLDRVEELNNIVEAKKNRIRYLESKIDSFEKMSWLERILYKNKG